MLSLSKTASLLSVSLALLLLTSCGQSGQKVEQQPTVEPTTPSTTEQKSETKTSESETTTTEQKSSSVSSKSAKQLEPGDYCFEAASETLDAQMQLTLAANQQVTGKNSATIHNDAQGYYTSYSQEFIGILQEGKLPVDITTKIEGDTQVIQENWTLTPDSVSTGRATYQRIPCSSIGS